MTDPQAYVEGYTAFKRGVEPVANPYSFLAHERHKAFAWIDGWRAAEENRERVEADMSERPQKPVFSPPKEDVLPSRAAKRVVGLLIAFVIVVVVAKAAGLGT